MRTFRRTAALGTILLLTSACRSTVTTSLKEYQDASTASGVLGTYFQALQEVDMDGVVSCLAEPDESDCNAAIDAMLEGCPYIVLAQGQYGETAPADIRDFLADAVADWLPTQPIVITYKYGRAKAVLQRPGDQPPAVIELRLVGAEWKIDAKATFAAHYGAGAVELDPDAAQSKLEQLRELKGRIDAGDFKRIEDAMQTVISLGFDIS